MIGRTFSHYRIESELGAGGMGEVYRAHDTTLDRDVALKVLPEEVASDPERLARFEREAKSLAGLNHPNIVTIHEVGEADAVPFLAMELVEGRTLAEIVPKSGLPLDRIFALAIPLADALAAAHDRGIVHRDLKPNNVMVTADGRVKVLDFGLAKLKASPAPEGTTELPPEDITREGSFLGTLPYMAPEQVQGAAVDERSDIFALGAVLYEMATGDRPHRGETFADLASAILRDRPREVDALRPDLPRHLARVIRRCLEKDPERRFQSAKDVRNELQDLARELETEEIVREATPPVAPTRRPVRKWLPVAAVAGVILVAAVIVGRNVLVRGGPESDAPGGGQIRSLAVLPFDNLMNDPDQEYFVQGMHEALITDLSKVGALRVISRTSAMRYQDTDKSIPEIARELNVDALIEGSVLRADGQVRITAQLIQGSTDEHLWADSYDRELENVLALLSDVAQAIAREVAVAVTPEQQRRLEAEPAVDPAVQDKLLQARFHVNKFNRSGFGEARELYREVVELDPTVAAGWAGLAGVEFVHGFFGYEPLEEAMPRAEEHATRALELDPDRPWAVALKGSIELFWHWDWEAAEPLLVRAVELGPNNVLVRHSLADYYMVIGDQESSVRQVREGARRDPMALMALIPLVGHLMFAGHYDEAVAEAERAIELYPEVGFLRRVAAYALWFRGSHEEALLKFEEIWGADSELARTMRAGYERGGPSLAMRNAAEYLAARPDPDPLSVARRYAMAGDSDLTFMWLEKAFEVRTPQLLHVAGHPAYDSIRDDPRYRDLLLRMGMPVE
jgi:TolB-like protein